MNPLFFTLTFLTLIGILTSSELVQHARSTVQGEMIIASACQEEVTHNAIQRALFEDLSQEEAKERKPRLGPSSSPQKKKKNSTRLNFNTFRPPNNSRLNFCLLIQEGDDFYYEVAARLMRNLYSETSYYTPHVEYRILDALIQHKDEMINFCYPDEMCCIDLEDIRLQETFCAMLKGVEAPSLLNFITCDSNTNRNQKKINLLFASPELLEAIFDNVSLCARLDLLLKEVWASIDNETHLVENDARLTRTKIRQTLTNRFDDLFGTVQLGNQEARKYFDFTLGTRGNILFLTDPTTNLLTRKKLSPRTQRAK